MFDALPDLPALTVDRREALLISSGSAVTVEAARVAGRDGLVRVTRDGAALLAVGRSSPAGSVTVVRPVRVFQPSEGAATGAHRA
jgi:hypothetical protein